MIILEGADCTGKTTLAQALAARMAVVLGGGAEDWRSCYRHMSRPEPDFDHVRGYLDVSARVQDRYHLGAIVYGAIIGGGSFPTAARMRVVQRYLRWQGCMVVILHADRSALRKRLVSSTKAEMYSIDDILDANDAYRALIGSVNRGQPYCDFDADTSAWPALEPLAAKLVDQWSQRWRGVQA